MVAAEYVVDFTVDQLFASIVNAADREGIDRHVLMSKLHNRLDSELGDANEPARKKRKTRQEMNEETATREAVMDVFLLNGLPYLPINTLSSFSLLSQHCWHGTIGELAIRHDTMRDLAIRCREKHPSLYEVATNFDENTGETLLSWGQWCQFEQGQVAPIITTSLLHLSYLPWPHELPDILEEIDVLLEVKQGDTLVWHGVTSFEIDHLYVPTAYFQVPHWSFEAPLPEENDVFSDDTLPEERRFLFWQNNFTGQDGSIQQKTLCKALHGAHSPHLVERLPAVDVRVVLRRRSTGQMVTVISQSQPDSLLGEEMGLSLGRYDVMYTNDSLCIGEERLMANLYFVLFCSRDLEDDAESVMFSTRDDTGGHFEYSRLSFSFDLFGDSVNTSQYVLRSMRAWFQNTST